jgi:hypothetical protein
LPNSQNYLTLQSHSLNEDNSSPKISKWRELLTPVCIKATRFLKWRFNQVMSIPSQVAWWFSKIPFVEENFLYPRYQKTLQEYESKLPILDSIESKIVDELDRNGICITSLEALGIANTADFYKSANTLVQELRAISLLPESGGKYEILTTPEQLIEHEEVFHWGYNERLLKIVEKYLGLPVAYDGLLFVKSIADGREIGPRAWHRDRECRKMIKVCVYLNDVVEEGGPFQCLQPELNSALCSTVKHRYKSVFNEELKTLYPDQMQGVKTVTGKAGTVFFVDTARYYHRGQPPTKFNRNAIFFSYFSRRPWHPFFCQRSPFSKAQLNSLTAEASTFQRDSTYWKDALPWFVKLIPRSRI